jgi:hypothetical protein
MILALDKYSALYVFASTEDAQQWLEAIDVQRDAFEFCDAEGRHYVPEFIRPPRERRFGPIGTVDVGLFKLVAQGDVDPALAEKFVGRAAHIEHTSFPTINTIEELRHELRGIASNGARSSAGRDRS